MKELVIRGVEITVTEETYKKYWIQVQYQLLVTGYKNAMLCCALVDDKKMYRYQEFLINTLGTIESLGSVESTFVMDTVKHKYGINI